MLHLKRIARRAVDNALKQLGYKLIRLPETRPFSLDAALKRIAAKPTSLPISSVIDVGASDGRWSKQVVAHYPDAHFLLIEANQIHEESLKAFVQRYKNTDYVLAAAGDKDGEIYFDVTDRFGGAAYHLPMSPNLIKIPVTTIDEQVQRKPLKPPYLIKLDTHGFEIPILEGASETLKNSNLLIIEAYNFKLSSEESLRFPELCTWLERKGFRPVDLIDPLYRPKDQVLWQFDLLFIPSSRPEFQFTQYR